MAVLVAEKLELLAPFRSQWDELAKHAVEPNVFYESFLLESAIANLSSETFKGIFIFSEHSSELIGFFPLTERSSYRGLPVGNFANFDYMHCYLNTPLVRRGQEKECFEQFFSWFDSSAGKSFVELRMCRLDGPFSLALERYLESSGRKMRLTSQYERALLSSSLTPDKYIETSLRKKKRKEFKRLRRRLEELGSVQVEVLAPSADIQSWIEDFLHLEESGWKGEKGTALNRDPAQKRFFEQALHKAFENKKLLMLRLRLNGKSIAMQCHFRSGAGAFSFKIAFDEKYAQFSPGVMLEIELTQLLLSEKRIAWIDSCADPNHSMINKLWMERRAIGHLVIAGDSFFSDMTVAALGSAHDFYRIFSRRSNYERETFAI